MELEAYQHEDQNRRLILQWQLASVELPSQPRSVPQFLASLFLSAPLDALASLSLEQQEADSSEHFLLLWRKDLLPTSLVKLLAELEELEIWEKLRMLLKVMK